MDEENLSILQLARKTGCRYESLRLYLTKKEVKAISHHILMCVCKELKIKVTLNIELEL
jgi:transposase